jgi:hypothetical protein
MVRPVAQSAPGVNATRPKSALRTISRPHRNAIHLEAWYIDRARRNECRLRAGSARHRHDADRTIIALYGQLGAGCQRSGPHTPLEEDN